MQTSQMMKLVQYRQLPVQAVQTGPALRKKVLAHSWQLLGPEPEQSTQAALQATQLGALKNWPRGQGLAGTALLQEVPLRVRSLLQEVHVVAEPRQVLQFVLQGEQRPGTFAGRIQKPWSHWMQDALVTLQNMQLKGHGPHTPGSWPNEVVPSAHRVQKFWLLQLMQEAGQATHPALVRNWLATHWKQAVAEVQATQLVQGEQVLPERNSPAAQRRQVSGAEQATQLPVQG